MDVVVTGVPWQRTSGVGVSVGWSVCHVQGGNRHTMAANRCVGAGHPTGMAGQHVAMAGKGGHLHVSRGRGTGGGGLTWWWLDLGMWASEVPPAAVPDDGQGHGGAVS